MLKVYWHKFAKLILLGMGLGMGPEGEDAIERLF